MEKLNMAFVLVTHLIAVTKCLREKRRVYVNHSLSTRHILVGGRQWWETASGYYGKGMSLPAGVREDDKKQSHTINLKVCSLVGCSFWKLQNLLKQQLAHKCSLCVCQQGTFDTQPQHLPLGPTLRGTCPGTVLPPDASFQLWIAFSHPTSLMSHCHLPIILANCQLPLGIFHVPLHFCYDWQNASSSSWSHCELVDLYDEMSLDTFQSLSVCQIY